MVDPFMLSITKSTPITLLEDFFEGKRKTFLFIYSNGSCPIYIRIMV